MIALLLAACAPTIHTTVAPQPVTRLAPPAQLASPGPIVRTTEVSARWAVPLSGLLDLEDPRAAHLDDSAHPIVLPVHVLEHPTAGTFLIDTGVPRGGAEVGMLLGAFLSDVEVVAPLADIVGDRDLAGVLLTHAHLDHVLGLPDVPPGVPIHSGPEEHVVHRFDDRLTLPALRRGLDGRPLTQWAFDPDEAPGALQAIDIVGDGSLYALHVPGHTPGSTAYLARTTEGPVLFTGDASHTAWGFAHGVAPGTYTVDPDANRHALDALRTLADRVPGLEVVVGHELAPGASAAFPPPRP